MKGGKKTNEMNYIKIRNWCSTEYTLNRVEKGKSLNMRRYLQHI